MSDVNGEAEDPRSAATPSAQSSPADGGPVAVAPPPRDGLVDAELRRVAPVAYGHVKRLRLATDAVLAPGPNGANGGRVRFIPSPEHVYGLVDTDQVVEEVEEAYRARWRLPLLEGLRNTMLLLP